MSGLMGQTVLTSGSIKIERDIRGYQRCIKKKSGHHMYIDHLLNVLVQIVNKLGWGGGGYGYLATKKQKNRNTNFKLQKQK
jgi:hypothetical protein